MDNAVALVEAYLRLNGYFTVTEYPILRTDGAGRYYTATDLDILALRFPRAEAVIDGITVPDPALQTPTDVPDMLIGEVKEGAAELNAAAAEPEVLCSALHRFGCCGAGQSHEIVHSLLRHGRLRVPAGHELRLVAFGNGVRRGGPIPFLGVPLSRVTEFLQNYLHVRWDALHCTQFKDPALGFLMALEKTHHVRSNGPHAVHSEEAAHA